MHEMMERPQLMPLSPETSDQLAARMQFEKVVEADREAGQMLSDIAELAEVWGVNLKGYDPREETDSAYADMKKKLLEKEAEVTQELFKLDSVYESLRSFGLERPYDA